MKHFKDLLNKPEFPPEAKAGVRGTGVSVVVTAGSTFWVQSGSGSRCWTPPGLPLVSGPHGQVLEV